MRQLGLLRNVQLNVLTPIRTTVHHYMNNGAVPLNIA